MISIPSFYQLGFRLPRFENYDASEMDRVMPTMTYADQNHHMLTICMEMRVRLIGVRQLFDCIDVVCCRLVSEGTRSLLSVVGVSVMF